MYCGSPPSLDDSQQYSYLYCMKATLDIPDDLYRRVKSRSALEGRPVRAVAIALFEQWLEAKPGPPRAAPLPSAEDIKRYPWLAISKPRIKPGISHDWEDIRASIALGWAEETRGKLGRKGTSP